MRRPQFRRVIAAFTTVALLLPLLALTAQAAVETVSGALVLDPSVELSPDAVAVVTITDRSKDGAGTIIGEQRIDGATATSAFAVPYDTDAVNPSHAYAVVASIIDGDVEYQNPVAVPTITGGATEGLLIPLLEPQPTTPTEVTGTISAPADTELSETAVTYAAVVNGDTGRVVGRQVNPAPSGSSIDFTVTYDADLVDPAVPLLAVAAIVDSGTLWQTESPAAVTPGTPLDLAVAERGTIPGGSPVPSGQPTPTASGSAEPTVQPTGNPTAEPTGTPTEAPTEEPTATATEAPSATPTEAPSASASPTTVPSETPTASPSASPSPGAVIVSGTLTYREPHRLDLTSVARIVVAQLQGDTPTVVGEQNIVNPGAVPIAFSVVLNSSYDPAIEARLWAVIKDGDDVWTTAGAGLSVAGPSGPTENVVVGMFFRPDLIEADVTGTITGTPADLSASAWSMTWVVDTTNDKIIGADSSLVNGVSPIPFLVPFTVADISTDADYVVQAAVFDGEREFRNPEGAGVPVITGGNPFKDVEVTVAQVSPSASPTPATTATAAASGSASPTAAASSTPAPTASGGSGSGSSGGIDPLILGVLVLVVIGGAVVVYLMRR